MPPTKVASKQTLAAWLYLLREFAAHYLQTKRSKIGRAFFPLSPEIVLHALSVPKELAPEMEIRLLTFDPRVSRAPELVMHISLDYFYPGPIGQFYTPGSLRYKGFVVLQICAKDDISPLIAGEVQKYELAWMLLDCVDYKMLSEKMPPVSPFLKELCFEQQAEEILRLYGGGSGIAPSLN